MSEKSNTVLLIEDNPADARLIRELLRDENTSRFELTHTEKLETGLERLTRGGIDVVLLDLSLPDSRGIDTFNQVHAHSPEVPIVVLTGLKDESVEARVLRAGGQDFLAKGLLNFSTINQSLQHAIERKQAEEHHDLHHVVDAAGRAHDDFLAVLGEELRTPLTAVLASIAALTDQPANGADLASSLAVIRKQVDSQVRLIDDLLTYARVDTRGKTFQPTDCVAVLARSLVNLKPSIDESGALITHDPLPTLWADATQIESVFQNLIGNAIHHHGEAPPRIHVAAERQEVEWVFCVRDNGIGFDRKYLERIFTIFQPLNDRDRYPGTGIGLAICKKIVERHAGRIWAESEPGWGSRFFFTILVTDGER